MNILIGLYKQGLYKTLSILGCSGLLKRLNDKLNTITTHKVYLNFVQNVTEDKNK